MVCETETKQQPTEGWISVVCFGMVSGSAQRWSQNQREPRRVPCEMCQHPVGTIPLVAYGVRCVANSCLKAEQNAGGASSRKKCWRSEDRLKHRQNITSQHIESSLFLQTYYYS